MGRDELRELLRVGKAAPDTAVLSRIKPQLSDGTGELFPDKIALQVLGN